MKRFLPLLIGAVVFFFALVMLQPEDTTSVVVAAANLPAGHTITEADLTLQEYPKSMVPEGAFVETTPLVGQTLRIERRAGDVLYPENLGGEAITLAPDERAIAIHVTDSGGLAGLLKPGDLVGVTAVLPDMSGSGTFGKAVIGGLRVLYISPSFKAEEPQSQPVGTQESGLGANTGGLTQSRQDTGTVVLAVPITARVVGYDFVAFGVPNDSRLVYAVDLLPALDQAGNAKLSLYLEPEQPVGFVSSGIYLPDLVRTPGPSPTPTETATPTPGTSYAVPAQTTPLPPQPTAIPTKKPKK
ncbi:MAG: Flp pilus assembly protein CpaB [Chloroflexota bacterium]